LNEIMKEVGKSIRGLFIMGEDIVLSEPNVSQLELGLNEIYFLVLQYLFLNETARFADVIFPASSFAEKDGTFTNSERRVQLVRTAVQSPGQARADWKILCDLANACGANWTYESPAEIYDELVRDAPKFSGISHARIEQEGGLPWPCPTADHPGTEYLHKGGVLRGKGLFQSVEYRPSAECEDAEFSLILSTGRTLYHYNADTQTQREAGLTDKQPEAFVEIHPKDAGKRGIEDGELVEVASRRGSVRCRAQITRSVRRGCIWMPFHFAAARANVLTTDAGDVITGTAEYKVCAAEVVKLEAGPEKDLYPGSYYSEHGPGPDVTHTRGDRSEELVQLGVGGS
jgi:predicted molibdopterin-dependent oxidoreductase YjgC